MSSRCTTRKPAASHTARPPASRFGWTGPPGAASPIVAPGAIARGLTSRSAATLEELVGRADSEIVVAPAVTARARTRIAAEARAVREAQLAAALIREVAELCVL